MDMEEEGARGENGRERGGREGGAMIEDVREGKSRGALDSAAAEFTSVKGYCSWAVAR